MDRRTFLGSITVLGMQGMLGGLKASNISNMGIEKTKKGKFDENLVVFISDLHTNPGGYQPDRLRRTIADILKMKPLPLNVIALGDLAYLLGKPEEYALLKEIITPMETAGIHFTMAMGNHDRRDNFAAAFPKYAAASLLPDRFVYIVETPYADIIVLDSLQKSTDTDKWITAGAIDENQRQWLEKTLMGYTKPVFVTAHHPVHETAVQKLLYASPTCCGYIYGHNHVWDPGWIHKNYSERTLVRTLCLPSTGHWGDIGYTSFRLEETRATAHLYQYEYFFPTPLEPGEKRPEQWKMMEEEHKDAICRFIYR